MNRLDELSLNEAGMPRPLAGYMARELRAVNAPEIDERTLERIPREEDREKVHAFLLTLRGPMGSKVLAHFERIAAPIIRRGWNLPVGCETLRGHARATVRGFTLNNDLAPFFVAALRAIHPEWAASLELSAPLARLLLALEWSPRPNE